MDVKDELYKLSQQWIEGFKQSSTGTLYDWNAETAASFAKIPIETLIRDPYFLGFGDKVYDGVLEDIISLFEERKQRSINLAIFLEGIGCIDPESWLWTEKGLMQLKDIKENIKTFTGKSVKEILGKKSQLKPTYRLQTRTGLELILSNTHPLWTMIESGIPDWKTIDNGLSAGDFIAIPKGFNIWGEESISEDLAWVLGCLIGDGSLIQHAPRISAHKDDYFIIEEIQRILIKEFKHISFHEHSNKRNLNVITLTIKGSTFKDFLIKEGIAGKDAFEKTIPLSVLRGNRDVWKGFLSGYFDTDGSSRKKDVSISSVSNELIKQVQLALLNFGIISRKSIKKTSGQSGKSITNRLKISSESALLFYNEIGFRLKRKQNLIHNFDGIKFNPNTDLIPHQSSILYEIWKASEKTQQGFKTIINSNYAAFPGRVKLKAFYEYYSSSTAKKELNLIKERLDELIFWDEVVLIEKIEDHVLIDLAVDIENQYCANGFINHNSGKTVKSSIIMWLLWFELSLHENPQDYFNLAPDSVIAIINLNRTERQAKKVTFGEVWNRFQTPFNKDYFPVSEKWTTEVRIPRNNTTIFPGTSSALSALGYNLYGGIIDEAAFLEIVEDSTKSFDSRFDACEAMYNAIMNRMVSRFLRAGNLPGLICMISSPNFPDDFMHRMIDTAIRVGKESGIFWRRRNTWEAKGEKFYPEDDFFYIDTDTAEIIEDSKIIKVLDLFEKFPVEVDIEDLERIAPFYTPGY